MIKFFNKQGIKAMEMKDNGDLNLLTEDLKQSFENPIKLEESKEKENEHDNK